MHAGTATILTGDDLRFRRISALVREVGYVAPVRVMSCADPRMAGAELVVADLMAFPAPRWRNLKALRRRLGSACIVVVLPGEFRADAAAVLAAGANGLVTEDDMERALPASIGAARAGQIAVPEDAFRHRDPGELSLRQKQILTELLRGCTNAEIAVKLSLAESTVKSHVSALFTKLGVRSRSEALAAAVGLVGANGAAQYVSPFTATSSTSSPAPPQAET